MSPENIQNLISSQDYSNVLVGLESLGTLVEKEEDLFQLIGFGKELSTSNPFEKIQSIKAACNKFPHATNIFIWILGKISSLSLVNRFQLRILTLRSNQLTELPDSIQNLTQLESLDLSGNQLTSLPETIGNLTHLKTLYLSNNHLS